VEPWGFLAAMLSLARLLLLMDIVGGDVEGRESVT
jgi:hypothetical protein